MTHFDFIVEGKLFVNGSIQSACMGVAEGKIRSVKKILTGAPRKTYPKQIILPAGVDIHVHFRDPGFTQKETFFTGSVSAAHGGLSCVFDMPNTHPQPIDKKWITDKITHVSRQSVIDFGVYGGICDENIDKIPEISPLVPGFKVFLGNTTASLSFSHRHLSSLFTILQGVSRPVLFHAEDESCLQKHKSVERTLTDHHFSRPPLCEEQAISDVLAHAPFPCPVHFSHISSTQGLSLVLSKKEMVSYGVTPHHSLLHYERNIPSSNQSLFKVNPPLRPYAHQIRLFQAVRDNEIPILESDHAPHTSKEKSESFAEAPSGIIGVETMYPLYLSLAANQAISFAQVIKCICEHPSRLMGLTKGYLQEGFDADFITVDIKNHQTISPDHLHSLQKITPFEGWQALFPSNVYIRGQPVIEENELVAKRGCGRSVIPSDSGS